MTTRELVDAFGAELRERENTPALLTPGPAEQALAARIGSLWIIDGDVLFRADENRIGRVEIDHAHTPEGFDELFRQLNAAVARYQELREMPYAQYLQTPEWKAKRLEVIERDGHRCRVCGATSGFNVHHITYEHRGDEPLDDLTTLCRNCHQTFHDNGKLAR